MHPTRHHSNLSHLGATSSHPLLGKGRVDTASGPAAVAAAAETPDPSASLVIQLPTPAAAASSSGAIPHPTAAPAAEGAPATQRLTPPHNQRAHLHPHLHRGGGGKQQQVVVASAEPSCRHPAATRDLMLLASSQKQHEQHYRHKYFQTNRATDLEQNSSGATTTSSSSSSSDTSSEHAGPSASVTPPPTYHDTTTTTATTTTTTTANSLPGGIPRPVYHGRTSGPPPPYEDVMNPHVGPPTYQSLYGQMSEARKTSSGLMDLLRQLLLVLIGTIGCTMIIGFLLLIPITMILVGFFYMHECRAENIPSFLIVGGFVWIVKNMLNCYNQFKKDSQTVNRPPPPPANRVQHRSRTPAASASATSSASPSTSGGGGDGGDGDGDQLQQVVVAPAATTTTTTATTTTTTSNNTRERRAGASNSQVRRPQMIGLTSYKCESLLNYFLVVWFLAGCIVVYRIYEPDYENPLSVSYCNRTVYLYAFWLMTSAFIIMAIVLSCLCCLMASSLMSCSHGR